MDDLTPREQMLATAAGLVAGKRDLEYGRPEDSFATIASHWSIYLTTTQRVPITLSPADVGTMMILLKVARLETSGGLHADSWVDIAGYAACGFEITQGSKEG